MKIVLPIVLMVDHSEAMNPCITDTIARSLSGASTISLIGCGLVDADHDDLSKFFGNVGRPTILHVYLSDNDFESLPGDLFKEMFFNTIDTSDPFLSTTTS